MKTVADFCILENTRINDNYSLMKIVPSDGKPLLECRPGQFVEIDSPDSKTTFLRRPISINYIDVDNNCLWLLIRNAGEGTRHLMEMHEGRNVSVVYPLGKGFTIPNNVNEKLLLVGGGVGVAPLYYLGTELKKLGCEVNFLLGARSKADLLELDLFSKVGNVFVSTDDGSFGEKGLVTQNSALAREWDSIYCCGPMPMMKAIGVFATKNRINCEVSLENKMACGVGACLCCVEDTDKGNVCVCKDGPVFNIKQLKWQI